MFNNTGDFRQYFGRQIIAEIYKMAFCAENQLLN